MLAILLKYHFGSIMFYVHFRIKVRISGSYDTNSMITVWIPFGGCSLSGICK